MSNNLSKVPGHNSEKILEAASATLLGHIFASHPEWDFLATPLLRVLDDALLREQQWETRIDRRIFEKEIQLMGNLVNIKEKPAETTPTFGKLSYNGCVHSCSIWLDYKMEFHFLAGLRSAHKVYEAHNWKRDTTSQDNDPRSIMLRQILDRQKGGTTFNQQFAWREAFEFEDPKTIMTGTKRKHQDD
ncbi:uncharacterized protein [Fopius arisanus]|uniref:Uncharacterized protein n=1 Tax=Fopius arisanus TaxID=64838 RepID=A0A9R1U810_9HYME|nr:PREDICTED: uncharacterized protein LOC105271775 [Fopius arisanus]